MQSYLGMAHSPITKGETMAHNFCQECFNELRAKEDMPPLKADYVTKGAIDCEKCGEGTATSKTYHAVQFINGIWQ